MKYLLMLFLLIASCKKECECFTPPEQFRIAFLDINDENLLDPVHPNHLKINKLFSKTQSSLEFKVTDSIGAQIPVHFYYLLSFDDDIYSNLVNQDLELYVSYLNRSEIDTINIFVEQFTTSTEKCDHCLVHKTKYIKHNGVDLIERDTEHETGAAIIRK